jgi:hypothetical protein
LDSIRGPARVLQRTGIRFNVVSRHFGPDVRKPRTAQKGFHDDACHM